RNAQARASLVGTIDPGFVLHGGERIRLVTGNPGKKSHGPPPDETASCKNYHLFLGGPMVTGAGTVIRLWLKQGEMAKGTFQPPTAGAAAAPAKPAKAAKKPARAGGGRSRKG